MIPSHVADVSQSHPLRSTDSPECFAAMVIVSPDTTLTCFCADMDTDGNMDMERVLLGEQYAFALLLLVP